MTVNQQKRIRFPDTVAATFAVRTKSCRKSVFGKRTPQMKEEIGAVELLKLLPEFSRPSSHNTGLHYGIGQYIDSARTVTWWRLVFEKFRPVYNQMALLQTCWTLRFKRCTYTTKSTTRNRAFLKTLPGRVACKKCLLVVSRSYVIRFLGYVGRLNIYRCRRCCMRVCRFNNSVVRNETRPPLVGYIVFTT